MKRNLTALPVCLLLAILFLPVGAAAQKCNKLIVATTPDASFTTHNNGTVTHKATGLMWMRCALGQVWDGKTCDRAAATYSWEAALQAGNRFDFAGHSDWRLPNKNELESIIEEACTLPAVNARVFPASPPVFFWSSSPYAGQDNAAWSVDFGHGAVNASIRNGSLHVRLVRGGR